MFNYGEFKADDDQEQHLAELNKKVEDVYRNCIGDNEANIRFVSRECAMKLIMCKVEMPDKICCNQSFTSIPFRSRPFLVCMERVRANDKQRGFYTSMGCDGTM